jgi:hypothetical protein
LKEISDNYVMKFPWPQDPLRQKIPLPQINAASQNQGLPAIDHRGIAKFVRLNIVDSAPTLTHKSKRGKLYVESVRKEVRKDRRSK